MKNQNKKKSYIILGIILLMFFMFFYTVKAVDVPNDNFSISWRQLQYKTNIFCNAEHVSMANGRAGGIDAVWYYKRSGNVWNYGKEGTKTNCGYAKAYILYTTKKATISSGLGYEAAMNKKNYYQHAWWTIMQQDSYFDNSLYKKAIRYQGFMDNSTPIRIENVSFINKDISFTIEGNSEFISLKKITIKDKETNQVLKTLDSNLPLNQKITIALNELSGNPVIVEAEYTYPDISATAKEFISQRYTGNGNTYYGQKGQTLFKFNAEAYTITKTTKKEVTGSVDISLQKFIIGTNISNNELDNQANISRSLPSDTEITTLKQRWNKCAHPDTDVAKKINYKTNTDAPTVNGEDKTKFNNPVKINIGDTVTYQIEIYNNTDAKMKDIYFNDFLQLVDYNNPTTLYGEKLSIGEENSGKDVELLKVFAQESSDINNPAGPWYETGPENRVIQDNQIHLHFETLKKEQKVTFRLTFKINKKIASKYKLMNYTILQRYSSATYRTSDADYIEMNPVVVSLQKYITEVNGEDITANDFAQAEKDSNENISITYQKRDVMPVDRRNLMASDVTEKDQDKEIISDIGKEGGDFGTKIKHNTDTNTIKLFNPVMIEKGDIVTYAINVYNNNKVEYKNIHVWDKLYFYHGDGISFEIGSGLANQHKDTKDNVGYIEEVTLKRGRTEEALNITMDYSKLRMDFAEFDLAAQEMATIIVKIKLNIDSTDQIITNYAYLVGEQKNHRRIDADFVVMKKYEVSLQKFVYAVNGKELSKDERADLQVYSAYQQRQKGVKDDNSKTWNGTKWKNPVTVNKDDYVTYEIRVTNDGITNIKTITILDKILGEELSESGAGFEGFYWGRFNSNQQLNTTDKQTEYTINDGLKAGETKSVWITLKVSENNISLDTLTNHAEIKNNQMTNKNNLTVTDTTLNNNADEDYIILDDITISGLVWNDKRPGKQQNYNGFYDSEEPLLENIKVYLYREGYGKIAETTTNEKGKYVFSKASITSSAIPEYARYIKAPKMSENSYWMTTNSLCEGKIKKLYKNFTGYTSQNNSFKSLKDKDTYYGTVSNEGYYAYYVEFEYDGIKYTTSIPQDDPFAEVLSGIDVENAANVYEDLQTRKNFNKKFKTINEKGAKDFSIDYTTKNAEGYVPESNYVYDGTNMAMTARTNTFQLTKNGTNEEKLHHVNAGLKGRDIFDLDITAEVHKTRVTVNGVSGDYTYGNQVQLRGEDIPNTEEIEDMATTTSTPFTPSITKVQQNIRKTDIQKDATNGNYAKTGLEVEVTYKLTIENGSVTYGTATQVTDYYDARYDFVRAYGVDENQEEFDLQTTTGKSGTGYQSVCITTTGKMLSQSKRMEIYVVLNLRDAENTLKALLENKDSNQVILRTGNIAEIDSYVTVLSNDQTEFTRGLIDKDSAPGSVSKETARTMQNQGQATPTTGGNPTTLDYYYANLEDLSNFKAEDDTGVSPVLYFVVSENRRTLTGIVFEDNTITNTETRVKTGNGKLEENEIGIWGATVELVEINPTDANPSTIADNYGVVRYQTTSGTNGEFTIEGFLPGNYLVRYRYGDTVKTALLHQNGNVNTTSYNGEDYQSTNNIGTYDAAKLIEYPNYWYIINEVEGISTGTDNTERRNTVRGNVTSFSEENLIRLSSMRDMIGTYSSENNGTLTATKQYDSKHTKIKEIEETKVTDIQGILEQTKMYASTPAIRFELEKPIVEKTGDNEYTTTFDTKFNEYTVNNMNFGIAGVPITTVIFKKHVQEVTIMDSTGQNVLASGHLKEDGTWETVIGDVLKPNNIDISIEEDKLQGARLQVTYAVITGIRPEINFDETKANIPKITGMIDFIDNGLSYNEDLSYQNRKNSEDWETTSFEELKEIFIKANQGIGTVPKGTVDPEGLTYTTIIKAKEGNDILLGKDEQIDGKAMITLERILSAEDKTIDNVLLNSINGLECSNTVEITGIIAPPPGGGGGNGGDGGNGGGNTFTDRIRTENGNIIRPGSYNDATSAETITIHPPTGDTSIQTNYYILALISFIIVGFGVFGIKKFVLHSEK